MKNLDIIRGFCMNTTITTKTPKLKEKKVFLPLVMKNINIICTNTTIITNTLKFKRKIYNMSNVF
jgi:hypothetical protein